MLLLLSTNRSCKPIFSVLRDLIVLTHSFKVWAARNKRRHQPFYIISITAKGSAALVKCHSGDSQQVHWGRWLHRSEAIKCHKRPNSSSACISIRHCWMCYVVWDKGKGVKELKVLEKIDNPIQPSHSILPNQISTLSPTCLTLLLLIEVIHAFFYYYL